MTHEPGGGRGDERDDRASIHRGEPRTVPSGGGAVARRGGGAAAGRCLRHRVGPSTPGRAPGDPLDHRLLRAVVQPTHVQDGGDRVRPRSGRGDLISVVAIPARGFLAAFVLIGPALATGMVCV